MKSHTVVLPAIDYHKLRAYTEEGYRKRVQLPDSVSTDFAPSRLSILLVSYNMNGYAVKSGGGWNSRIICNSEQRDCTLMICILCDSGCIWG